MTETELNIRPATQLDHAALEMICLKTADAGDDATELEDDPTLVGRIFAVPYQILEPEFAFVAEDKDGVCGYVLGALDSVSFEDRIEREWYASLRKTLRDPGANRDLWKGSDWARHHIHYPPPLLFPELAAYRSHGHIDILPRGQGRGLGRRLINRLEDSLKSAGSKGIHLGVNPVNHRALAFYKALGYADMPVEAEGIDAVFVVKSFSD